MDKQAAPLAATGGPDVSYKNLFNPLSPLMGGGDKYPEFVANMFPNNPRGAWMASKAGAVALLAAAIAGGIRGVQHLNRVADMRDEDDPGQKLDSQLSTTFAVPLGKHASEDVPKQMLLMPPTLDTRNVMNTAVPVGATLLAAALAWKGMDTLADNRRNKLLTDAIAAKSNTVRDLMQTRARIAKGNISDAEVSKALGRVDDESNYVKTANTSDRYPNIRRGVTGLGLLVLALAGASAAGSYAYFKASDPGNIQYKALKSGLQEYARNKTGMTPITTIPQDAGSYFQFIDEGAKPKSVREMNEKEDTHRPISVTL